MESKTSKVTRSVLVLKANATATKRKKIANVWGKILPFETLLLEPSETQRQQQQQQRTTTHSHRHRSHHNHKAKSNSKQGWQGKKGARVASTGATRAS